VAEVSKKLSHRPKHTRGRTSWETVRDGYYANVAVGERS
jgi:hypothetical protein